MIIINITILIIILITNTISIVIIIRVSSITHYINDNTKVLKWHRERVPGSAVAHQVERCILRPIKAPFTEALLLVITVSFGCESGTELQVG